MIIVISPGHGLHIRGASGIIDEVDEARKVVPAVADHLRQSGNEVIEFYDNTSTTQSQNLNAIVNAHNSYKRDLDVSVHFNAYQPTPAPRGTEVLYVSQKTLAIDVARAISEGGKLINRGAKHRTDLAFLNKTNAPAILIEVCFVDSAGDVEAYQMNFEAICRGIAMAITGDDSIAESQV